MDQQGLRKLEAQCIQEEPPLCKAGCPLGLDGRGFAQAMAAGKTDEARAILEKTIPLAEVFGRLCEAPCEQYCLRKDLGGAIRLGKLERVCIETTTRKGKTLKLPPRATKVAVLGGGPSSLTVANDLIKKGYPVTVYHLTNHPGGWLRELPEDKLPAQALTNELDRLAAAGVHFTTVDKLDGALLDGLTDDAVYIGQDTNLTDDLQQQLEGVDQETYAVADSAKFTGGWSGPSAQYRLIFDLLQGRGAALSIDRYLQKASLTAARVAPRHGQTGLFTESKDIEPLPQIEPAAPTGDYTPEEAQAEAARCIDCQCLECVKKCVYLAEYKGYPKSYARRVYNNSAIVKGVHQANTFINSCSLCRQCEVICPHDFSMADLCLSARQLMVNETRMPPSAHWFALKEMRAALGEESLVKHAVGQTSSSRLFFPGCQLTGTRPEQAIRLYDRLLELQPDTAIWLSCCGAPAHWSGRRQEFSEVMERFVATWEEMGKPQVITACSSCLMMIRDHLPAESLESVWKVLATEETSTEAPLSPLALSDPCTARHDTSTQGAVRDLLAKLGQPLAELEMSGELTECCGYGGLLENTDPKLARKVVESRVAQTDGEILTYCAMCRDRLASTGKPVHHLLDLLFPETRIQAGTPPATISERRVNRRKAKKALLARYPEAEQPPVEPWETIELQIPPEVAAQLEERRILEDDIRQVLYAVESGGDAYHFAHGEDGRHRATARLGLVTFWIEYHQQQGRYELLRCWSHRMSIHQPIAREE